MLASKKRVTPVLGGVKVMVSVFVVSASRLAWNDKSVFIEASSFQGVLVSALTFMGSMEKTLAWGLEDGNGSTMKSPPFCKSNIPTR